jgi:hypothetical protein
MDTIQRCLMRLEVSNKFTVHCDICGDAMLNQGDTYACYPCKHMLYESELWQYDSCVVVHDAPLQSGGCVNTPINSLTENQ